MSKEYYEKYIENIHLGLKKTQFFIENKIVSPNILFKNIKSSLRDISEKNNNIFFFGNGASAAFANHMALDFSKNGKIISRSLSDSAFLTALSNDYTFERAMVEYLKIQGVTTNDFVITISSSGNSSNIINVLEYCKLNKINTLALSGLRKNNKSIQLAKNSIYVPMKTYGMVECIHQIFLHCILDESMGIFEWQKEDFQDMNSDNFKL